MPKISEILGITEERATELITMMIPAFIEYTAGRKTDGEAIRMIADAQPADLTPQERAFQITHFTMHIYRDDMIPGLKKIGTIIVGS